MQTLFPANFELSDLDGANGFALKGMAATDRSGRSISTSGDINGDGVTDLLIGAYRADPDGRTRAGETYVVFGGRSVGASGTIKLSDLNGNNGFALRGEMAVDTSGECLSAVGDVNGDSVSDIIIGADQAVPPGGSGAGKSYGFCSNPRAIKKLVFSAGYRGILN